MRPIQPDFAATLTAAIMTFCHCSRLTRRNGVVQGFKSAPLLRRKEETMLLNKSVQFGLAALAQVGLARQAEADAQARHAKMRPILRLIRIFSGRTDGCAASSPQLVSACAKERATPALAVAP